MTLQLLSCTGLIAGVFLLLGIKPLEFSDEIFLMFLNRKKGIKAEISEASRRKKPSLLEREILEAQEVLNLTGRGKFLSLLCAVSLLLSALGAAIAILMHNWFLVPVLGSGFLFLPFWYVKLTKNHYQKAVAAELETSLSIITTAYLRTEDILTAVQENLHYLNPPVKHVFSEFITQIKLVNPDVDVALKNLREQINNEVFKEWADALGDCQYDRNLKSTLAPIVGKLSDIRIVNGELENLVFEPRKEFITMVILVLLNIPLLYALNKEWFDTLLFTAFGQIILSITAAVIFISTAFVIKLTKPIEYKR